MTDFGSNIGYVDDLYERFLKDPASVSAAWREFFADYRPAVARAGARAAPAAASGGTPPERHPEIAVATLEVPERLVVTAEEPAHAAPPPPPALEPLQGAAARLAANMEASLAVPTATSMRTIPVKLLEENRRIINEHRKRTSERTISYTHLIAFALLRALERHRAMNDCYEEAGGKPHRARRDRVRLGLAIDIERRGQRSLLVPNIPDAERLSFAALVAAYDDVVERARGGRLAVADLAGTTVTLTNPGMIGTVLSVPRLPSGQGTIVGIGSIGYPAEFSGMSAAALHRMGVSPVMTVTSTYDHRVIQGAESGAFLATLERILMGDDGFWGRVFDDLGVRHLPLAWSADGLPAFLAEPGSTEATAKQARVLKLINAYRVRGHLMADLNPLAYAPVHHPELALEHYGLSLWDLDREFITDDLAGEGGTRTLRSILDLLRRTYCGYLGAEYMYIAQTEIKLWLKAELEKRPGSEALDAERQRRIFEQINAAEAFERFLHSSYVGHKRFSLEGCETLIPALVALIEEAAAAGVEEIVLGMTHRGRLNVLANVLGKSLAEIFQEFEDIDPKSTYGSGDVKYHLGASGTHRTARGGTVELRLASNPSHLESVNPVVQGIARARQMRLGDRERRRVMAVQIHGDAAFAGQGVVAETLNMAQLRGYATGGTIHLVVNNQIGFTTLPSDARSTHYASDIAKSISAPILHVNADHPQAAVRAVALAVAYRQRFQRDVVVDLICYRKWGHNEADEPAYTQPVMVEKIRTQRPVRKLYAEQLLRQGDIDVATAESLLADFQRRLEAALLEVREWKTKTAQPEPLPDLEATEGTARPSIETGVPRERLAAIVDGSCRWPPGFEVHPKLAHQLEQRREALRQGRIDWALAESLAFGSLVLEGVHVRLSGQDSARGTFSPRHAVLYDQRTEAPYTPLANLASGQAPFHVYDSLLSEFAVMGFEYGYSIESPGALVAWEAQFGDFANGAQVIIDQYISSGDEKWRQPSALVLLLPHGWEGQGPEHSSARLERWLQLCAEGNLRIANPSTPAQYFHLLRRQVRSPERKPLVVMTPKSLLRLPATLSPVEAFVGGAFEELLSDRRPAEGESLRRLVLTSGKLYWDLAAERRRLALEGRVALLRLEQFYPFPREALAAVLAERRATSEVVWAQEEPRNMGAWEFVDSRIEEVLAPGQSLRYAGRPASASPASGSLARHRAEQQRILDDIFAGVGS